MSDAKAASAMILAAGLGTRLRPLTHRFAKPVLPLLNVPIMYYAIENLLNVGIEKWVVNTHHLPEQVREVAKNHPAMNGKVQFSHEAEKPLGSGGGIFYAKKYLGTKNFWVVNADEIILPVKNFDLNEMLEVHEKSGAAMSILVIEHPEAGKSLSAVWADSQNQVGGFGKTSPGVGLKPFHYIGILLISEKIWPYFGKQHENIFYDVAMAAKAAGERVQIYSVPGAWYETGYVSEYLHAAVDMAKYLKPEDQSDTARFVKKIVAQYSNSELLFDGEGGVVVRALDAKVEKGTVCSGAVAIGAGAQVAHDVSLTNAVILPQVQIAPRTKIQNEVI